MLSCFRILLAGAAFKAANSVSLEHHYVSKCCERGFALDKQAESCVPLVGDHLDFPPENSVLHEGLGLSRNEFVVNYGDFPAKCSSANVTEISALSSDGRIFDGYLLEDEGTNTSAAWLHYHCVDYQMEDDVYKLVAVICSSVASLQCLEETCIQKCCPFGYYLAGPAGCVSRPDEGEEMFVSSTLFANHSIQQVELENVRVKTNFYELLTKFKTRERGWDCHDVFIVPPEEEHQLLPNGSLQHLSEITDIYCADLFPEENNTWNLYYIRCAENLVTEEILLEDSSWTDARTIRRVNLVLISISLVAIIFTLIVYLVLPDLRNLHGKIIISNLLAIMLVSLFLISTYSQELDSISPRLCIGVGYFGYFGALSMMVWMTTMCFDLCWTFTRAKIPDHNNDGVKFMIYSLISWGIPLLVTLILVILQTYLSDDSSLNPRIGEIKGECFVARSLHRKRNFLYIPLLLLMIVNVLLFLVIVTTIFISKSKTSAVRTSTRKDSGKNENRVTKRTKEQLTLYMKLFVVVGVLWCGECLHQIDHHEELEVGGNRTEWNEQAQKMIYATQTRYDKHSLDDPREVFYRIVDCLNLLRGLFLFFIFVCKRNIYLKLVERIKGKPRPAYLTDSKRTTVSSKLSTDTTLARKISNDPQPLSERMSIDQKIELRKTESNERRKQMNSTSIRELDEKIRKC